MSRKKRDWLIFTAIVTVLFILIIWMIGIASRRSSSSGVSFSGGGDKVAVIELAETIYESKKWVDQFEKYGEDNSIKAIVFKINSPGGGVAPSQEIYEAARRVRDNGKPIVALMGTVAASGGYYVACASDTIMAGPGTTTGSLGVIVEIINLEGLYDKIGVDFNTIKSGKYKDIGSPNRKMTSDERRQLQAWIDDAYDQFVDVIVNERPLTLREVKKVADGRVFTGRQALALGLVDTLGYYKDAVALAADMAGIEGEPSIVKERKRKRRITDLLFEDARMFLQEPTRMRLAYLWR